MPMMPPDDDHPRKHALSMASATHLKNMGHIDGAMCDAIHKKCGKALGKKRKPKVPAKAPQMEAPAMPFGSFAPKY